ncbi:MAG TPA: hypothetical protein VIM98_00180 [Dyella sp.]|uniref:hypothetical protein n=1 Tax=Dyella sp. TaxID=1869338 RepID=UPI002F94F569
MKKLFLLALLLTTSYGVAAQGVYIPIPYYGNDPFTFCTLGWPPDCWAPIDPALGTFTITDPECYNPTSSALYVAICPAAFTGAAVMPKVDSRKRPVAIG